MCRLISVYAGPICHKVGFYLKSLKANIFLIFPEKKITAFNLITTHTPTSAVRHFCRLQIAVHVILSTSL